MRRQMDQCSLSCVPRKRWFVALVFVSVSLTAGLIIFDNTFTRKLRSKDMEEMVAIMKTRLQFLEFQYQGRQQDIADEQERVDNGCKPQLLAGNDVSNATFTPELKAYLKEISGSKASDELLSPDRPELIKAPFSLRIMPHLMEHPDSLRPAYQLRSKRQFSDYIIGVPHVKRDKETYLYVTIRSLLEKMTETDKNDTMIVVMVGETNMTYVVETAYQIETRFPKALEAGLIEVISPHESYYPDLDALPQTLGDSKKRVKWRTKQNLDAIFLMAYAHTKCLYYLMIEDDVLAADEYMTLIKKYTAETSVLIPDWFFIQYSTTGGIGKLFRSTDLVHFMTYVQLFYRNMPIDWLTESYLADRNCGINKGAKECAEAKVKIRPTYKKNLFKHIGLYSSLKGKIQNVKGAINQVSWVAFVDRLEYISKQLTKKPTTRRIKYRAHKDKKPKATPDFFPHENPPVTTIKCDLVHHLNYSIMNAYKGVTYFWGKAPAKNNVIEFWFEKPGKFNRYLVRSGNLKHVNDRIYKAVFEILPVERTKNGTFETIDRFDEFGMVEGEIDTKKYEDLYAMRIRFDEASKYWVTITEIEFAYTDELSTQPIQNN